MVSIDCADSGGPGTTSNGWSRRDSRSAKLRHRRQGARRLRCKGAPHMIGIAIAEWLLDQQTHDRLGDALGRDAEQLEQLPRRGGLTEAIDADHGPRTPDVLVPEVRRPRLDSNAR